MSGKLSTLRCIPAAIAIAGLLLFQVPGAWANEWHYEDRSTSPSGVPIDVSENTRTFAPDPPTTVPSDDRRKEDVLGVYNETQHVDDYWHYTSAVYIKQTNFGKIIGQMNHASKNDDNGLQAQLSTYPELSDEEYLQLSYAYSESDLFPRHYASGELYTNRAENLEFSAGAARHEFDSVHVNVLTGSMSVYKGYFMYRYRPTYFTPNEGSSSWLHRLVVRRYFEEENRYVSLEGSAGRVPDLEEPDSISSFNLKIKTLILSYQFPVHKALYIKLGAGYSAEEFPEGRDREKMSLLMGVFFQL